MAWRIRRNSVAGERIMKKSRIKKILYIFLSVFLSVVIVVWGGWIYLTKQRKIEIYHVSTVHSDQELWGNGWKIIYYEEQRACLEKIFGFPIPKTDFSRNYLLLSLGRQIKEIRYNYFSQYQWEYDIPMGVETFEGPVHPHKCFIYTIERTYIRQNLD